MPAPGYLPSCLSPGECPGSRAGRHMVQVRERPPGRAARWGRLVFPHPLRPGGDQGATPGHTGLPVHGICAAQEQALAQALIPTLALRRQELPHRACGGCAGRL
jgi:hypothetical protein